MSRTEVACIDVTTSVPAEFAGRAQGWFADRVTHSVTGPMRPATYYLRATEAASYSDSAGLVTVTLPEVPAPPDPPALPTSPYETVRKQELQRSYADRLATQQAQVEAARQQAAQQAEKIRTAALPRDNRGTDVLGCEIKAGDLLGDSGERTLFVATDLIPNGQQQALPPGLLKGVAVVLTQWCTDDAATCRARRDAFAADVHGAGAASFAVIDPQQLG
ncbi:MAG: hypothetical protein BGP03_06315 [Pseudonocardia sp. 73-21]|nr:MAG: hypothetical protein BGP03_06315 [Pseudonocardia sp. 73-21]